MRQPRCPGPTQAVPTLPESPTLRVPFRIVERGGRKELRLHKRALQQPHRTDSMLVKLPARVSRWKGIPESDEVAAIGELAEREGIALAYLTRVLPLTCLQKRSSRRSWT